MTQIIIDRIEEDDFQTLGELEMYVGSELVFECKTLELPWGDNVPYVSRIPENHYEAVKHLSPKFGETIWIKDVPNRSEILIHKGNYNKDTLGCILLGKAFVDIDGDGHKDVVNSANAVKKLYDLAVEPIYVNIFDSV
jgi:hypothetical protein